MRQGACVRACHKVAYPSQTVHARTSAHASVGVGPSPPNPQGQANKWVKNMEGGRGGGNGRGGSALKVLNLQMGDMARQVENAIQFGQSVLLQDILETIDPILEPVLAKAFIKRGNQTLIKLGDKEVDYNQVWRGGGEGGALTCVQTR